MRKREKQVSVERVCQLLGYKSRQSYYKIKQKELKEEGIGKQVIKLVKESRHEQTRKGCRKVYLDIKEELLEKGIKLGRDKLFKLLKMNDMLIKPKKNYRTTTNSKHHFYKYRNKIKELELERPEQVWVSDITYVRIGERYGYLFLITDAYSKQIMGWHIEKTMKVEDGLKALRMALRKRKYKGKVIHHSDRGIQYCAPRYTKYLEQKGLEVSMTEKDHVYENSIAERVNGILKGELGLGLGYSSIYEARQEIRRSIEIYNTRRRHTSIGYYTPSFIHLNPIVKLKKWGKKKLIQQFP